VTHDLPVGRRRLARGTPPVETNDISGAGDETAGEYEDMIIMGDTPPIGVPPHYAMLAQEQRRLEALARATPAHRLAALAHDADEQVREGVAWNPATPDHVRAVLATDASPRVRATLVSSRTVGVELLERLGDDEHAEVRRRVVLHLPPARRARFVHDPSVIVRNTLAVQHDTPVPLLAQLARDPEAVVRVSVAAHAATPDAVLLVLAADLDREVRWTARGRVRGSEISREHAFQVLGLVAVVPAPTDLCGEPFATTAPKPALAVTPGNDAQTDRLAWAETCSPMRKQDA
jgi:hypothetical protein